VPLLRKYLPILLALALALWAVDHLGTILGWLGADAATLDSPLLRALDRLPLSQLLGVALVVVAGVWGVKWFRHRTLVAELEQTVRRKAMIERVLERAAAREAGSTPAGGSAPVPQASPEERLKPGPQVVFGPGERQRVAADQARAAEARGGAAPAAPARGAGDALRNDLAMAQPLLTSHLATTLAMLGVQAPPARTADLLMSARERILADPGAATGDHGRDLTHSYLLAARMAEEVRAQILEDAELRGDRDLRTLADVLVDVHRVLLEGPGGSWGQDTVEGFIRDSDPGRREASTAFARKHGPMGKVLGGLTSGQLSRPLSRSSPQPRSAEPETVPGTQGPRAIPPRSDTTYHYTPKKKDRTGR